MAGPIVGPLGVGGSYANPTGGVVNGVIGTMPEVEYPRRVLPNPSQIVDQPGAPPVSTLTDDFSTQDTTTWTGWGANVVWNARGTVDIAVLPGYFDLHSTGQWRLTGSSIYVTPFSTPNVVTDFSEEMALRLYSGANVVAVKWAANGGTPALVFIESINGVENSTQVTYSATAMKYWRIRNDGVNNYWDYSADAVIWTNGRTKAVSFDCGAMQVSIQGGYWGTATGAGTASWDAVNVGPTVTELLSQNQQSVETSNEYTANVNSTIAWSTAQAHTGTHSAALTSVAAGDATSFQTTDVVLPNLTDTYTPSFWVFSATAGLQVKLYLDWRTSAGAFVSNSLTTVTITSANTWQRVVGSSVTPPATAGRALLSPAFAATAAGQVVYFDDMSLLQVSSGAPAYTGTANLAGSGALTATTAAATTQAAGLTGSGSLTATTSAATATTATLTGSGALTTTQIAGSTTAASLTGSGALTSASQTPQPTTSAALTGAGALAAANGAVTAATSAPFTGSGTLGAAQTPTTAQPAALSGLGTLTATTALAVTRPADLSGSGALAATATPRATQAAALSGAGTLAAATAASGTPSIRQAAGASLEGSVISVALGAGTAVGDLLVIYTGVDDPVTLNTPGFSQPVSNLTSLASANPGGNGQSRIWGAVTTVAGAQNVTLPASGVSDTSMSVIVLNGSTVNVGDYLDGTPAVTATLQAASASMVAPSVTPATSSALLVCAVQTSGPNQTLVTFTPPPGMTEQTDLHDSGNWQGQSVATQTLTTSGATGTRTFTASIATKPYTAISLAIKGVGAGVATTQTVALSGSGTLTATTTAQTTQAAPLTGSGALTATLVSPYRAAVAADSPSAWWHLDETSGATTFADAAGTNPLTIGGTPTLGAATLEGSGGSGAAASFSNAAVQYGQAAANATFAGTAAGLSVEALVQSTGVNGNNRIIEYGPDTIWSLYFEGGTLRFAVFGHSTASYTWPGDTARHHVAGTYDAATGIGILYLDGVEVARQNSGTTAGRLSVGADPLRVAQKPGGTFAGDGWNGVIDEAALYPAPLSAAQVAAHASAAGISPATAATLNGTGALTATTTPAVARAAALSGAGTLAAAQALAEIQSAALSGSGALTATVTSAITVSAALSGSGALTGTQTPAASVSAPLTGSGALSAVVVPAATTPAALTGSGSLVATQAPASTQPAALSGTGTAAATTTPTATQTATLTGSGALTATVKPAAATSAPLTGSGALAALLGSSFVASAPLAGSGTLGVTATPAETALAGLSGSGTLTASQTVTETTTAALTGSGSLAASQTATTSGTAAATGSGALTATTGTGAATTAAASGTGALAATTTAATSTPAALTGLGAFTAASIPAVSTTAPLSGSGSLTATQRPAETTTAALSGAGALTASTAGAGIASAPLTGSGSLTSTTRATLTSGVSLNGSGSLAVAVNPAFPATAALSGSGALTASTSTAGATPAALTGSGSLTAVVVSGTAATAPLAGSGSLTATTSATRTQAAPLSGSGSLTTTATVALATSAALNGQGTLTAQPQPNVTQPATLAGSGALTATVGSGKTVPAALSGDGALVGTTTPDLRTSTPMAGTGALSASTTAARVAAADLSGLGALATVTTAALEAAAELQGLGALAAVGSRALFASVQFLGTGALTVTMTQHGAAVDITIKAVALGRPWRSLTLARSPLRVTAVPRSRTRGHLQGAT